MIAGIRRSVTAEVGGGSRAGLMAATAGMAAAEAAAAAVAPGAVAAAVGGEGALRLPHCPLLCRPRPRPQHRRALFRRPLRCRRARLVPAAEDVKLPKGESSHPHSSCSPSLSLPNKKK